MLIRIDQSDPAETKVKQCAEMLRNGKVIVCPTDTVYAYVCSSLNSRAIEKLAKLKGVRLKKANLSLLCADLRDLSQYAKQVNTPEFRLMKQALPGPYTFILKGSSMIPAMFKNNKRTIGIRVPNDAFVQALIQELGHALAATSVHSDDDIQDHFSDPQEIAREKGHLVEAVVDGGNRGLIGSTVIDLTGDAPVVLREGAGPVDIL